MQTTSAPKKWHIDFMRLRWLAFILSLSLSIASCVLPFTKGLNFGIDFVGGIVVEIRTDQNVNIGKMRAALGKLQLGEVALQNFGGPNDLMIRVQEQDGGANAQSAAVDVIKKGLKDAFPDVGIEYRKVDYVGAQVGGELIHAGIMAMLGAFAAIMAYIWIRFEWQYGVGAIMALLHDATMTIGFYSISGLEFNLTSVAAILTIVGYSINDSVVIYDRIRENLRKYKKMTLLELINVSLNETLSRTLNTVGTTLLATLALVLWGGEVIQSFSLAMFFGVIVGTYSSIFISAPLLVYMNLRRDTASEKKPEGNIVAKPAR